MAERLASTWSRVTGWPWLVPLALWTAYGVGMSTHSYMIRKSLGRPMPLLDTFALELAYTTLWAALTPVVVYWTRRHPLLRANWRKSVLPHVAGVLLLPVVHKFIWDLMRPLFPSAISPLTNWPERLRSAVSTLDYGGGLYFLVVAATLALDTYRRQQASEVKASRLESQLAQSQLAALKAQLHPHFLFNTLNTISALVHDDPDAADRMIARLSELLRSSLETNARQEVSLRRELALLDRYLAIEQVRFADRLNVSWEIQPEALAASVPNLLLQPLVENAIRHGLADRIDNALLEIRAVRDGASLQLSVADNGCGPPANPRAGVGLSNTRARLRQLYGDRQSLELRRRPGEGAEAVIRVPWQISPGESGNGQDPNPNRG